MHSSVVHFFTTSALRDTQLQMLARFNHHPIAPARHASPRAQQPHRFQYTCSRQTPRAATLSAARGLTDAWTSANRKPAKARPHVQCMCGATIELTRHRPHPRHVLGRFDDLRTASSTQARVFAGLQPTGGYPHVQRLQVPACHAAYFRIGSPTPGMSKAQARQSPESEVAEYDSTYHLGAVFQLQCEDSLVTKAAPVFQCRDARVCCPLGCAPHP